MKVVKSTAEYTIYQKRNQRYGVKNADKKWVNGEEKVKILLAESLVKAPQPKAEPEPEPAAEEAAGDGEESQAEEKAD